MESDYPYSRLIDPVVEFPTLILALAARCGPVSRVASQSGASSRSSSVAEERWKIDGGLRCEVE